METAIQQIMKQLDEAFEPMDAKVLEQSKEWAKGRIEALRKLRSSDGFDKLNEYKRYEQLHAVAGGKTWYNAFWGKNWEMIEEFVTKNCAAIAKKRNANISKKLEKAGVSKINEVTFGRTHDGFNGIFMVETDKGKKRVTIETIYAGGYNIQCLHLRVLTKIK